ncbi:MAG TPA: CoA transferase [Bacteroidetes bacterium]|nr:CoA transferase [Bacteroidota bacterium]
MDIQKPLEGIKVLELASVLAGPSIGMFLAELGADVIKVENLVTDGDVTRKWKLPTENPDSDISGYFSSVNWGKKSLAIDISKCDGLNVIYELVKQCDIVLANYKPGDAEKLQVDYQTFKKLNPKLIYSHVTGYGLTNQRAGFDAIIQAESGFTYMNGEPDGPPTKMPVALMDVLAAHHHKEAILVALLQRERGQGGCYIDASLFKSGVSSLVNQATNWLVGNKIPQRMGSDHPNIVPYGTIFNTSDGKGIVIAVGTEKQFAELCDLLGKPELATDVKFSKNFNRVKNKDEIKGILQDLIIKYDRETILQMLANRKVPAGGVFNMQEVFETPEAQEMVLEANVNGSTIKGVSSVAFGINGSQSSRGITHPPHYGEHTYGILCDELGIDPERIESLISQNIIYAANK